MVNFELYKIFIQVAKTQNLTKASENLNISQPAITKHIKNLENELNTTLFIRTKGMQLTENGKKLYEKILPAVNSMLEAEKQFLVNKNIKFGTYATMLSKVLSDCIADFYQINENAKITAITEPFVDIFQKFLNYELDIVVLAKQDESTYDTSKIKYIKLSNAEFILIANNNSNLCGKEVNLKDLKDKIVYLPRAVSPENIEIFKKVVPENQIKLIDSVTMCNIVQKYDNCIGMTNRAYVQDMLKENRVVEINKNFDILDREFGIYVHKDNYSKDLEDFIKVLQKKNYN